LWAAGSTVVAAEDFCCCRLNAVASCKKLRALRAVPVWAAYACCEGPTDSSTHSCTIMRIMLNRQ
jgi:hypothetical protein